MVHGLWGLSWGEILSLVTLVGGAITLFSKLVKGGMESVLAPLRASLDELNGNLKRLNGNFHRQENEIEKINEDLRHHELQLQEHDLEIKNLKEDTNHGR
ncbi:hypothetical protein [Ligilactobacillus ruminis]|uniref:hypothetical protein n=1 Tax=Ligilactobacillus ruminis TaxID=1623 RepID=UPI0034A501D5|nr:hypothetical protein [Lactobacillus sp.]